MSSILCPAAAGYHHQGVGGSPAKHVAVVQQPHVQIHQPQILGQAAATGQQQYVPVSVVEPGGRQMLLTVSYNIELYVLRS